MKEDVSVTVDDRDFPRHNFYFYGSQDLGVIFGWYDAERAKTDLESAYIGICAKELITVRHPDTGEALVTYVYQHGERLFVRTGHDLLDVEVMERRPIAFTNDRELNEQEEEFFSNYRIRKLNLLIAP